MAKKNSAQFSLFPETLYEYHVMLLPGEAIIEDVDNLKVALHEMIGVAEHNLNSIAHITLLMHEGYESTNFAAQVKAAVAGERKFIVKVNGWDKFENGNGRTLYLKVEDPAGIDRIAALIKPGSRRKVRRTDRQISILDKPGQKPKLPTINPHIVIARDIPTADFDRITDFTLFDYNSEWVCDKIIILRRISGTQKGFSPHATIRLS